MTELLCVKLFQLLCRQVFAHQKRTNRKTSSDDDDDDIVLLNPEIPDDILVDIFSRLPAEYVVLCGYTCKSLRPLLTIPSFAAMHFTRTTPTIAFHYMSIDDSLNFQKFTLNIDIHFTDIDQVATDKIVTKHHKIDDLRFMSPRNKCLPLLYASYNGFMLFTNKHDRMNSALHIWNPATQENMIVPAPGYGYCIRGLFFHPMSKEYRALFMYEGVSLSRFWFLVSSVGAKIVPPEYIIFSHPPSGRGNPTILNDTLHWVVDGFAYERAHDDWPHCANSIVLFNMETEEFCTKPHPGGECYVRDRSKCPQANLMEMEGLLYYCDCSSGENIVVWILEDYGKWLWARKHVVLLAPMKKTCKIRISWARNVSKILGSSVEAIHIYGQELLIILQYFDIFLYNLQLGTFRRVGKMRANSGYVVTATPHINSLISLRTCQIPSQVLYRKSMLIRRGNLLSKCSPCGMNNSFIH